MTIPMAFSRKPSIPNSTTRLLTAVIIHTIVPHRASMIKALVCISLPSGIIKSTNLDRIKENIDSISFDMEKADYKVLDDFQNEKINSIEVNWNDESDISIDQLANQNEDDI